MALLPLAWLGGLTARGRKREVQWWFLAVAFAVSWLADTTAHWLPPLAVSVAYPIAQATIVIAVFDTKLASQAVAVLTIVTMTVVALQGTDKPDAFVHTVIWLFVAAVAYLHAKLPRLRIALLVYFGLGLAGWIAYVIRPGIPTWSIYQSIRLLGLSLFCWAALQTSALRLARTRV